MTGKQINDYQNLRKKNLFIELLPWIGGGTSTAIYPNVYLSRKVYKNIHGANPDPYKVSTVIHEEEHIKRISKVGAKYWYRRYFLDKTFRLEEELAASKPQFSYLKTLGLTYDLDQKAKVLSGHLYFWPASKEQILDKLKV